MKKTIWILLFVAACALTGCASDKGLTVRETVGPGKNTGVRLSGLKVFTATERHRDGDNTYYYPHSAYLICDTHGVKIRSVINHIGTMDETPTFVPLTPGRYVIVAQADGYGRVRIPVVVRPGRATVIHLERDWQPPRDARASDIVRMPDGQPIGWASASPGHSQLPPSLTTPHRAIAG